MSRFYVRPECIREDQIVVDGSEARHISRVMRLGAGDSVICFDGTGREYSGIIESASPKKVMVKIERARAVGLRAEARIVLAQAVPKKDRMDYIIQKCTELGVSEIVPMITARTVVTLDESRKEKRISRWRKIAVEASKQCGRTELPRIEDPVDVSGFLKKIKDDDLAMIACLFSGTVTIRKTLDSKAVKRIIFLVGPEGGFNPEEIESARAAGCVPVTLGRLVLKSDTAAVAALAVIQAWLDKGR